MVVYVEDESLVCVGLESVAEAGLLAGSAVSEGDVDATEGSVADVEAGEMVDMVMVLPSASTEATTDTMGEMTVTATSPVAETVCLRWSRRCASPTA